MNLSAVSRPKTFWLIAIAALLWNLIGVAMFLVQINLTPEMIAALPAEQREVYAATPPWLNVVFGVAVFAGVLGALGLLLKKRWALGLFVLSLLAVLLQMLAAYLLTPAWQAYGAAGLAMPVLLVVIALALVWYARKAAAKGWIA